MNELKIRIKSRPENEPRYISFVSHAVGGCGAEYIDKNEDLVKIFLSRRQTRRDALSCPDQAGYQVEVLN
jgi:hypothetical protein